VTPMVDYPTPRSAVTHPDDARPDAKAFGPGFLTPVARDDRSTAGTAGSDLGSRYRAVIDHLPAVLYIDGVAAGTSVLDVSPRIRDLLGIEPADLTHHLVERPPRDFSDAIRALYSLFAASKDKERYGDLRPLAGARAPR